jgi:hypothetical protein
MTSQDVKKFLSVVISFALVAASLQVLYGYQGAAPAPANDTGNPTDAAPMSASELQSLVAPIALYPDALVAQILGAPAAPVRCGRIRPMAGLG